MRTLALTILLALSLAAGPARAQQVEYEEALEDMQTLMATQQRRFEAVTTNDFAALDSLLAPNLVYTHSSGQVDTKETFVDALRSGATRYLALEPSDIDVQLYGDTGVILGKADVRVVVGGEERALTLRFIEVYVQWEPRGPWQLVAWQSTRLP